MPGHATAKYGTAQRRGVPAGRTFQRVMVARPLNLTDAEQQLLAWHFYWEIVQVTSRVPVNVCAGQGLPHRVCCAETLSLCGFAQDGSQK